MAQVRRRAGEDRDFFAAFVEHLRKAAAQKAACTRDERGHGSANSHLAEDIEHEGKLVESVGSRNA